jgi:hypothetical protein
MSGRRKKEEGRRKKTYTASFLVGLKHFPAPLKGETLSREWKETDNLKMSQTLGITRLMPIRAKSISLSAFEGKRASVFCLSPVSHPCFTFNITSEEMRSLILVKLQPLNFLNLHQPLL